MDQSNARAAALAHEVSYSGCTTRRKQALRMEAIAESKLHTHYSRQLDVQRIRLQVRSVGCLQCCWLSRLTVLRSVLRLEPAQRLEEQLVDLMTAYNYPAPREEALPKPLLWSHSLQSTGNPGAKSFPVSSAPAATTQRRVSQQPATAQTLKGLTTGSRDGRRKGIALHG